MRIRNFCVLVLALCLSLSACGQQSETASGETADETVVKGRYLEHDTDFPDFATIIALDQVAPDTFYALGSKTINELPFEVICSTDGGATWEPREYKGIADLTIREAAFTAEGGLYVLHAVPNPEDAELSKLAAVYADGQSVQPIESVSLDDLYWGSILTDSGELLLQNYLDLEQVNLETGSGSHIYTVEDMFSEGSLCVYDNRLAISQENEILLFDTDTGASAGNVPYVKSASSVDSVYGNIGRDIAVQPDRSGFFYCDREGLFRVSMDGSVTEQFIDGALATFGMPKVSVERLYACANDTFALLCHFDGKYQLLRYVFDPNLALEPAQELILFTLREDPFVQQVIGLYHKANPDVKVTTYVGVSGEDSVLAADAVRTLSTELLAGKGPDIMVLDGLPIDSYRQKGVLAELSDALGEERNGLLPNVSADFAGEGATYALPTRISIPVIAGVGTADIHSLSDLAAYVESQDVQGIGVSAESVMTEFYPVCAARWFPPEGGFNFQAAMEDLMALKQLAELQKPLEDSIGGDMAFGYKAVNWSAGNLALLQTTFSRMPDAADLFSAMEKRGEGELQPFPDAENGIYLPSSILGVNTASSNLAAAKNFVVSALDTDVQAITFDGGVAVTMAGLEAAAHSVEPGTAMVTRSSGSDVDEMYILDSYWPDNEFMQQVMDFVQLANTPVVSDEAFRELVLAETNQCITGVKPVGITVQSLSQTVERYFLEQGLNE